MMRPEYIPYTDPPIEVGTPEAKAEMREAHAAFISAGYRLLHAWDEEECKSYPDYLPSFDEFLAEFHGMMEAR